MSARAFDPLRVPEDFWSRDHVQSALRLRDIGSLFRLLRKYTGISQMRIGMAVGLEQGYISKIMNDRRSVSSIDLLERIAAGCDMPDPCRMLLGLAPCDMPSLAGVAPVNAAWPAGIPPRHVAENDELATSELRNTDVGVPADDPSEEWRRVSPKAEEGVDAWPLWFGTRVAHLLGVVDKWQTQCAQSDTLQTMLHQEMLMFDAVTPDGHDPAHAFSRRQALATLAALPLAFGAIGTGTHSAGGATESFLSRCAASLTACWHMLRGTDLHTVHQFLSRYLLELEGVAQRRSPYQETAARLASQAHRICGIVALHRNQLRIREHHCQRALYYAVAASDPGSRVSALISLASTYFYDSDPMQAAGVYEQALSFAPTMSPLQRSRIHAELSVVYGQLGREQESIRSAALAEQLYPDCPERDPSFLYAEFTRASLTLERGLSFAALAERYPGRQYQRVAADIFARVDQAAPAAVPDRIRYEIINHQARTAVALRDLDAFEVYMSRAIDGVVVLKSKQRQKEMIAALRRAAETWPEERRLKAIGDKLRPAITAG